MTIEEFKEKERIVLDYLNSMTKDEFVSSVQAHFNSAPWHNLFDEMLTPEEFVESIKFNDDDSDLMEVIKRYPKFEGEIRFKGKDSKQY